MRKLGLTDTLESVVATLEKISEEEGKPTKLFLVDWMDHRRELELFNSQHPIANLNGLSKTTIKELIAKTNGSCLVVNGGMYTHLGYVIGDNEEYIDLRDSKIEPTSRESIFNLPYKEI